jgi:hypothetical protein
MWLDYLTAMVSVAALGALWVTVQRLWQRHFPDRGSPGGDALANRSGCHGCGCHGADCEHGGS